MTIAFTTSYDIAEDVYWIDTVLFPIVSKDCNYSFVHNSRWLMFVVPVHGLGSLFSCPNYPPLPSSFSLFGAVSFRRGFADLLYKLQH